MLINDTEFNTKYASKEFDEFKTKIKNYIEHPDLLQKELKEKADSAKHILGLPKPDEFSYYMTRYKGLLNNESRLKNFFISLKQPRTDLKRDFLPTIMDIEPVSRCNFRCIMCQLSGWENGQRTDDLDLKDYQSFIDSQYGLTEIKLQGVGEPLLHPDFFEMVRYAVDKDIWVRTTLNGSLLHNGNYKKLIDSGIHDIQISFDGATKETFEKIRRQSNFDQVMQNVTELNNYANALGKNITNMWVLLQQHNQDQLFDFVDIAKKMQFKKMTFSIGMGFWGQQQWEKANRKKSAKNIFDDLAITEKLLLLKEQSEIDITIWDLQDKFSVKSIDKLCPWPFQRIFVGSDMRISPCCMIANPDILDLGDARTFKKHWNDAVFMDFREKHLKGDIPEVCKNCYEN